MTGTADPTPADQANLVDAGAHPPGRVGSGAHRVGATSPPGADDSINEAVAAGPASQAPAEARDPGSDAGTAGPPRVAGLADERPSRAAGPAGQGRAETASPAGTAPGLPSARRPPHAANTLNELPGEEWLYFTKSVWSTSYPSELGHEVRRQHGANKPPRLMARLIEFFSRTGELVLDPFAGVGGTLLGAAIARGPRQAIGIELSPRWAAVYEEVVGAVSAERDGLGPLLADLGPSDPGGRRPFDPSGCRMRTGDALALLPEMAPASVDFIATDPPYNIQLPLTMAGGPLAEHHANRRTDYAMVTSNPADLANRADYAAYLDAMGSVFAELLRVLRPNRYATVIVRDAYQDGRYIFTGADLASVATRAGFTLKGDVIWYQAGTRLRPYGYPHVFVPNIAHQHILVLRREDG